MLNGAERKDLPALFCLCFKFNCAMFPADRDRFFIAVFLRDNFAVLPGTEAYFVRDGMRYRLYVGINDIRYIADVQYTLP